MELLLLPKPFSLYYIFQKNLIIPRLNHLEYLHGKLADLY